MIVRAVLEVSSREQGQEDANWASQLFGPKAEHQRLVDSIHGDKEGT